MRLLSLDITGIDEHTAPIRQRREEEALFSIFPLFMRQYGGRSTISRVKKRPLLSPSRQGIGVDGGPSGNGHAFRYE